MNDSTITLGIIIIIVAAIAATMIRENKAQSKRFKARLKRMWGQIPDREYTHKEMENISHYAQRQQTKDFMIDDITWNDLDMDRIFMMLNQTVTSPGEDYLYYLLRKPEFTKEPLDERNRLIEFFSTHEKERQRIQTILGGVKKLPNTSLSDAVHVISDIELKSNLKHIMMALMAVASIVLFMLIPKFGVFILIAVGIFNIGQYMFEKGDVDPYLTCFQGMLKMLTTADKLETCKIPEIKDYLGEISAFKKEFDNFRKGSSVVVNRDGAAGGLEAVLMDYLRMFTHIDLIKFNRMVLEIKAHSQAIDGLLRCFGMLDSVIAIASFREAIPYYTLPEFLKTTKAKAISMKVTNLYHPLIKTPVANSIAVKTGTLITGSNASGKSTFLKNMAINTLLAQSINTCVAKTYEAPFLKVMTSMALRDDLQGGESYYIVEIKSLNRILAEAKKATPMLCVIDEVLRGTNTIERIAASSRILAALNQKHVLTFAATHDIELTYILDNFFKNYHFEEDVLEHDVVFNYLLKKGRATTRNAIRLLDMIGYDQVVVRQSQQAAEEFEKNGVWTPL